MGREIICSSAQRRSVSKKEKKKDANPIYSENKKQVNVKESKFKCQGTKLSRPCLLFCWGFLFLLFAFAKAPLLSVTCQEPGSLCFYTEIFVLVLTDASEIYFRSKGTQTAKEISNE